MGKGSHATRDGESLREDNPKTSAFIKYPDKEYAAILFKPPPPFKVPSWSV